MAKQQGEPNNQYSGILPGTTIIRNPDPTIRIEGSTIPSGPTKSEPPSGPTPIGTPITTSGTPPSTGPSTSPNIDFNTVTSTSGQEWTYNKCNGRYWTPRTNNSTPLPERIFIPSYGYSVTKAVYLTLPTSLQATAQTPNPQNPLQLIPLTQYLGQGNTIWVSWDAVRQEWLTMDKWQECPDGNPTIIGPGPVQELSPGKVFTTISDSDKLPTRAIKTTYGIWLDPSGSTAVGNLLNFFTCSIQDSSSYVRTVYQAPCNNCGAEPHFDIAYGHDAGSGSRDLGGYDWLTPSNAIYGQYKSLCLNPGMDRFYVGKKQIHHFYAINVKRDRMGDRLDEGNVEVNLARLSGSQFLAGNGDRNAHTGSNVKIDGSGRIIRLIDDSRLDYSKDLSTDAWNYYYCDVSESKTHRSTHGGEAYYIVSGSLEEGVYNLPSPHVYGISYPRLGVWILDADVLDVSASFLSVTGSDVSGDNAMKLFTAMSGSAKYTDASGDYLGFQARKVKFEYVDRYFIRVNNRDYNFTNNPTYTTGSDAIIIDDFQGNPKVYITSIGLYNQNRELLAVGKTNRTLLKSYTSEALFTVKLRYD